MTQVLSCVGGKRDRGRHLSGVTPPSLAPPRPVLQFRLAASLERDLMRYANGRARLPIEMSVEGPRVMFTSGLKGCSGPQEDCRT